MFLLLLLDVVLWLLSVSAFAGWFDWIVQLNYLRIFVFFYEQKSKIIKPVRKARGPEGPAR